MSSAPAPQLDPIQSVVPEQDIPAAPEPIEYIVIVHLTRTWVQYGIFGFAVLCIVIGAVEALFGR